jgi:multidrug resistance efflux pump
LDFIAQVIPGLLVLLIGYLGCSIILALIVWFIAVTLITSAYAGAMANVVDIAPNFAGYLFSIQYFIDILLY